MVDIAPDSIRTGPLGLYPPSTDVLCNVAPPVRGVAPGPGCVAVALAGLVEEVVTLTVRVVGGAGAAGAAGAGGLLHHDQSLGVRGAAA